MRHTAALLAAAFVAGCSGGSPEAGNTLTNVAGGEGPTQHDTLYHQGWSELWGSPAATVKEHLNRLGYRFVDDYKAAEGGLYRSEAVPTPFSDPAMPDPNTAHYAIEGSKDRVERLVYRLDILTPADAATARARLASFIHEGFWALGVPGDTAVAEPLKAGKAGAGQVEGADWTVELAPVPGGKPGQSRITVTFSRPDPAAPAKAG